MTTTATPTSTPYAFSIAGYFTDGSLAYRAYVINRDGTRTAFATVNADGAATMLAAYFDAVATTPAVYSLSNAPETPTPSTRNADPAAFIEATHVEEVPSEIWRALRARLATW